MTDEELDIVLEVDGHTRELLQFLVCNVVEEFKEHHGGLVSLGIHLAVKRLYALLCVSTKSDIEGSILALRDDIEEFQRRKMDLGPKTGSQLS